MSPIVVPFLMNEKPPALSAGRASALLSARVAVGVINATRTLALHPQIVAHADENARRLVLLVVMEIVSRAAVEPTTTATDLLAALQELLPNDAENGAVS